ncbi:AAA family ATPase [Pseudaminobacter soli (ex Li et al. 2025)]|uniref:Pilus assembly protein n=1 Tax=Pseudaminobacter soli (ex Li et al. 2025) TaxID=1295366 RepID=A0A2P7S5C4_9HYPH|nr:response regulator/pilus assembly protein [Mesorhizobium soli]PSJ57641.1 pilus assembly protein [Mesorhizobium soli]
MNAIDSTVLPTRRKQIAVYSSDQNLRHETAARLEALAIYDVQIAEPDAFLKGAAAGGRPNIIILDLAQGEILDSPGLMEARAAWSQVPLIAISGELRPDQMRNLIRLNASDWLHRPLDGKELLNAVTFHDSGNQANKSRIITFIGASGGTGATTLALAAAEYLAAKSPDRAASTCLVDLDFQSANCGAYLNLFNQFDLGGIVAQPDRLDVELMDVIKLSRPHGLTIYSFERPQLPFEPRGSEFVFKLLDLAAYRFSDIVIDLPNLETAWQSPVLSTSDEVFIVFELNLAALRQAKRLYGRIRELRGNAASITLVANKQHRKWFGNHFSRKDLEKVFKVSNIRSISFDQTLLTESLNRAILPTEVDARARFNKDVKALLRDRLDGNAS